MAQSRDSKGPVRFAGWQSPPSIQDLSRKLSETGSFLRGRHGRGPSWKVWLIGALFLWAGYTALAGPQGVIRLMEVSAHEHDLRQEISFWQAKLDSLNDLDERIPVDPHIREKIAREDFGLVHPNELIYFTRSPDEVRMGPGMWSEEGDVGDEVVTPTDESTPSESP